jgi:hypothetical protein
MLWNRDCKSSFGTQPFICFFEKALKPHNQQHMTMAHVQLDQVFGYLKLLFPQYVPLFTCVVKSNKMIRYVNQYRICNPVVLAVE